MDRKPLRLANDPVAADELQFFERVREDTKELERIELYVADPQAGWSYTYWRASYVLAGRRVLEPRAIVPLKSAPDVIALWRTSWRLPRYKIVWADENSALLRRKQKR
jgi:hypothetical protein